MQAVQRIANIRLFPSTKDVVALLMALAQRHCQLLVCNALNTNAWKACPGKKEAFKDANFCESTNE